MARVYSHRRNRNGNQLKAKPIEAMYAAGCSIASVLLYAVLIALSIFNAGDNTRWIGGIGFLGFVMALVAFIYNIRQMRTPTELTIRIICMAISSVAFLIYIATYVMGILH